MPPILAGIGSSDEDDDDDVDVGAAGPGGAAPPLAPMADKHELSQTFSLSQSGAFKVSDFQIRPEGGLMPTIGESSQQQHAHPEELPGSKRGGGRADRQQKSLVVDSLDALEMLNELGSGASGTVFRARHVSSNTIVAVKCVTILEKSKRDQVVKELRIMQKQVLGARWLVALHNAFYEEAKVYTVIEMMDGGSVEDLVARHAPNGGHRRSNDARHASSSSKTWRSTDVKRPADRGDSGLGSAPPRHLAA